MACANLQAMASVLPAPPSLMQTSRPREGAGKTSEAPDADIPALVAAIVTSEPTEVVKSLERLGQLTSWQQHNQEAVFDCGAPSLILQLLSQRLPRLSTPGQQALDEDMLSKALWVLMNLGAHDGLAARIASVPSMITTMVALMSCPSQQVAIYAARCLINLTHSHIEVQDAVEKAGVLQPVLVMLLKEDLDQASCKVATWLLANLTSSYHSSLKDSIVRMPSIVARVVELLDVARPEAVKVLAASLVCNIARASPVHQETLADAGSITKLMSLIRHNTSKADSKVLASALTAMSALALDHPANTATICRQPGLADTLGLLLETRSCVFEADSDDARAVLAAHILIHVLGHMLCNGRTSSSSANAGGSTPSTVAPTMGTIGSEARSSIFVGRSGAISATGDVSLPGVSLPPKSSPRPAGSPQAAGVGQQAVYIPLSAAARAVGVELPTILPSLRKDGSSHLTTTEVAELRYLVSDRLLPRLREPNNLTATKAAAQLYHIACSGPHAETCRKLMADSALVNQLLALLNSQDPQLVHSCLCVLDMLSQVPSSAELLMRTGWLDKVVPLLNNNDAMVRRWAERALCSLYMGSGHLAK